MNSSMAIKINLIFTLIVSCSLFNVRLSAHNNYELTTNIGEGLFQHTPTDTINPEQRLPYGAVIPIPKRISAKATAEKFEERIDPPNWWVGFKDNTVELMIHSPNIGSFKPSFNLKGVRIVKTEAVENINYLFVKLQIGATATLGDLNLSFKNGADSRDFIWNLSKKSVPTYNRNAGLDESDFIYLIMPDRFANADTSNDSAASLPCRFFHRFAIASTIARPARDRAPRRSPGKKLSLTAKSPPSSPSAMAPGLITSLPKTATPRSRNTNAMAAGASLWVVAGAACTLAAGETDTVKMTVAVRRAAWPPRPNASRFPPCATPRTRTRR